MMVDRTSELAVSDAAMQRRDDEMNWLRVLLMYWHRWSEVI
jgi:hypothetical protein